jgi:hypothetical protein
MVRIRLRRIGLKGQPTYRIVAADKEAPAMVAFWRFWVCTIPAPIPPRSS